MKAEDIIRKYRLNKTTWTFKGFHGIPFTFGYVSSGIWKSCKKHYGFAPSKAMWFISADYVKWYWPDNDMRKLRKVIICKATKDSLYLKKTRKLWLKKLRKLDALFRKLDRADFRNLSEKELFGFYGTFEKLYSDEFGIVMAPGDAFSMYSSEFLEPAFLKFFAQKGMREKFNSYYPILMAPVEESFMAKEKRSMLLILKAAQKTGFNSPKVRKMLASHQKKFFWIRNNYAKQGVLSQEFFNDELKSMVRAMVNPETELAKLSTDLRQARAEKKRLVKALRLPKQLQLLISMAEDFSAIQDERKKYVLIANHYVRRFMDEIARRRHLPTKTVEYLVYPETSKQPDLNILRLRYNACFCIQIHEGYQVYQGREVDRLHWLLFGHSKSTHVTEIHGVPASKGVARGIVKIVQKTHDLINFRQGDILVSSMTRPEMAVALKKAAAIVTDEGGITSHAAIVSRELRIPCLIGTKVATKVLKDGDEVEVDANQGIVRKIK